MKLKLKHKSQGFTLIEVVLVLAIGGLIFLLAFIAFQQVSSNRRDTQRRNDAGRILAELQNAQADGLDINTQQKLTGGSSPASQGTGTSFLKTYFNGSLEGPDGSYTFVYGTALPSSPTSNVVAIGKGVCNTDNTATPQAGGYVILMKLETGAVACRDDR